MTTEEQLDQRISRWFEAEGPAHMPDRVLQATFERTRGSRQRREWLAPGRMHLDRRRAVVASVAVVVVAVVSVSLYLGQPGVGGLPPTPTAGPSPTADASPTATAIPTSTPHRSFVGRPSEGGVPLGWSSDGTRLLLQKGDWNLFVVHADGSETRLTENMSDLKANVGSQRPSGATISPDGSRVVFAGQTRLRHFCHYGALFTVDADGGPAELLWASHLDNGPGGGIIRDPVFSPDGTQIAFVDDYCDRNHGVWVMNADGSNPHQIVWDALGAGHAVGLAWSAGGDRIALLSDVGAFTFATDGSDFRRDVIVSKYCWPYRHC